MGVGKSVYSYFLRFFILLISSSIVILSIFYVIVQFKSTWDPSEPLNVILVTKKQDNTIHHSLTLLSIRKDEGEVSMLPLSDEQVISALGEYGSFRTDALYQLYKMEKRSNYLSALLAYRMGFLGVHYIEYSSDLRLDTPQSLIASFSPWNQVKFKSSLSLIDRYHIWLALRETNQKKMYFLSPEVLQDRSVSEALNTAKNHFSNVHIKKRAPTVAIVNSTDINGFANDLAGILDAYGFAVIHVSSDKNQSLTHSKIVYTDPNVLSTQERDSVKVFFPNSIETVTDEKIAETYRSDIVLFLGKDLESIY